MSIQDSTEIVQAIDRVNAATEALTGAYCAYFDAKTYAGYNGTQLPRRYVVAIDKCRAEKEAAIAEYRAAIAACRVSG